jgi:hypothetical protein
MMLACLDACPLHAAGLAARSDPRNPLVLLLEECDRAQELGWAEKMLNAKEPDRQQAEEHFRRALAMGLTDIEQFRRAVVGLYLARYGADDPPALQREILAGLERWVDCLREEERTEYPLVENVTRKIEEARPNAGEPPADAAGAKEKPDPAGSSDADDLGTPTGAVSEPSA